MAILFFGVFLSPLYFLYPNYDKILHLILPILGSMLLFFAIDKIKIDFKWKLLMAFALMITILTIFELGEYILDFLFDLKLQGVYLRDAVGIEKFSLLMEKNNDTMLDFVLGILGSLVYTAGKRVSYLYKKKKREKTI